MAVTAFSVATAGLLTAAARVALTLAGHPGLPWLDGACLALWMVTLGLAFRWLRSLRNTLTAREDQGQCGGAEARARSSRTRPRSPGA